MFNNFLLLEMIAFFNRLGIWLNNTRSAYLNFLRNLTPQVFLASMAWLFAARLDFGKWDWSNWGLTLGFWTFLALFIYAFWSNTTTFVDDSFADMFRWVKEQEQGAKIDSEKTAISKTKVFKAIWRERKVELLAAVIIFIALEFVLTAVVASSIVTSVGVWNAMKNVK